MEKEDEKYENEWDTKKKDEKWAVYAYNKKQ